jgi:hypothetical protein
MRGCECPYNPAVSSPTRSTYVCPSSEVTWCPVPLLRKTGKGGVCSKLRVLPPGKLLAASWCSLKLLVFLSPKRIWASFSASAAVVCDPAELQLVFTVAGEMTTVADGMFVDPAKVSRVIEDAAQSTRVCRKKAEILVWYGCLNYREHVVVDIDDPIVNVLQRRYSEKHSECRSSIPHLYHVVLLVRRHGQDTSLVSWVL